MFGASMWSKLQLLIRNLSEASELLCVITALLPLFHFDKF